MSGAGRVVYLTRMEASMDGIRRVAREHLNEGIVRLFLKQAWAEFTVKYRTRLRFRNDRNDEAVRAYCAMTESEFEGINARQKWANWRTIPRNLCGRLPLRPCRAVDLCSGAGHSTEVLAHYLPRGSEILGLEFNPVFVAYAARRTYKGPDGKPARVVFHSQSVLDTFRDSLGRPLADGSVDLVNSCGALGIHFDAASIDRLAAEIARVLRTGGLATVDSGTAGREGIRTEEMIRIFEKHGFEARSFARSCFLDRFTQIGLVKTGAP
jgi:SAM-dependent methyltransferase